MHRYPRAVPALAGVVLLYAGFVYDLSRPADARHYRDGVVQVAQSAHDAVESGWITGQLELYHRVVPPYADAAYGDATKTLSGAARQFAGQGPPDDRSAALRDQLGPLLQDAVRWLGTAANAGDDEQLRNAVDELDRIGDRLDAFVEAN